MQLASCKSLADLNERSPKPHKPNANKQILRIHLPACTQALLGLKSLVVYLFCYTREANCLLSPDVIIKILFVTLERIIRGFTSQMKVSLMSRNVSFEKGEKCNSQASTNAKDPLLICFGCTDYFWQDQVLSLSKPFWVRLYIARRYTQTLHGKLLAIAVSSQRSYGEVLLGQASRCITARALSGMVSALTTTVSQETWKSWYSFLDAKQN